MDSDRLLLFSGKANPALAQEIAKQLGMAPAKATVTAWSDGETRVQIEENVRGADVFLIQPTCPDVDHNLMQLLIMIDALKRASPRRITAVIPYYGYAKQEKKSAGREPITAKLAANLITVAGANRILTMDLHSPAIEGFFDIPVDHLRAGPLLADMVLDLKLQNLVVVSPDSGGVHRAYEFRGHIGSARLALMAKYRPQPEQAEIVEMVGEVKGRTAIIVDDMIQSGGTIIECVGKLKEKLAGDIYVCATHAIFAGDAVQKLCRLPIKKVFITNTIPVTKEQCGDKIEVVTVAPLLAEAIQRIHKDLSLSTLIPPTAEKELIQAARQTMNSDILGELLLLFVLICLNAFFAAAEMAIISVRKARLRQMLDEGVPGARLIQDLADNSSRLLATIQVGVTLAGFFAAATSGVTLAHSLGEAMSSSGIAFLAAYATPISVVIVTAAVALIMLVLGELVPKSLALQHSERVALVVARPLSLIAALFAPIVSFLSAVTDRVVRLLGGRQGSVMPFVTEDEIKTMVDAGEETGVLEESEKSMIYGVFGLGDTTVREVMVPRVDMAMVDVNTPVRQAASLVVQSAHSRLPVFEETPDKIIGVLHVKDLLVALADNTLPQDLRPIMRGIYFVPETKRVDDLLREMQNMSIHMAVVVDEYGGTAGLVTIEDLLEEIVGEIRDEHDREELQIERIDESTIIFSGRVPLDQVNELLQLDLSGEGVGTLGGYVAARLEKSPTRGDRLELPNATIEVLAAAARRAKRVKVTRRQESEGGTESPDD